MEVRGMGREDVEQALRAMDDDQIRQRLSQGEYEAVTGLDLTDEERTLVKDAAGDYPEVAGFAYDAFQRWTVAESTDAKHKGEIYDALANKKYFLLAYKYTLGT
jgi:hypothetical protein